MGTIVTLRREIDNQAIAHAFYNPHSLIAARVVTRNVGEEVDEAFFERRIRAAISRRSLLAQRRNAVRLVHGESDFLPGLIIDRFDDIVSFQCLSAGFDTRIDMLISILQRVLHPRAIVEKNDSHLRKLEGLPIRESMLVGSETTAHIFDEAGTKYAVDVLSGQKTGFFLDQMENRTRTRAYVAKGDSALDLFCNEGGFALNLALAGASHVVAVDSSKTALDHLASNAVLNGVSEKIKGIEADIFEYLKAPQDPFDVVVLDPPGLVRSKKEIATARKAYVNLNTNAMKLVKPEGILVTASCSHHIPSELFHEIIRESGRRAHRQITILEERGAGIDHPRLASMIETEYLKVLYIRVH